MASSSRRPNHDPSKRPSGTTADVTPTLAQGLRTVAVGQALDELLRRALERLGQRPQPVGLSTTWEGAQTVSHCLTALGCYLETQVHADRTLCRVLRVLKGNALAKQLSTAEAPELPEALARAALLACMEMEPPPGL
jgi:hypothetical protein